MAKEVVMPALGMAQEKGKVLRWLKAEGEQVTKGEPLIEVETDKATVEVEAPASGVLARVSAGPGEEVPVGQVIALILEPGESPPERPGEKAPAGAVPPGPVPEVPAPAREGGARPERRKVPASPKARRLARERGIDLASVKGSGPGGAVLAEDVLAAAAPAPTVPAPPPPEALPLSRIWHIMAERMTKAWTSIPHFSLVREVDAGSLMEMRQRITPAVERRAGLKPTYTDLLVKLIATVLRDHPQVNARWQDGQVLLNTEVHIGIATATEQGLVVPVIHNADRLSVGDIARRRSEVVERAEAGKLRPEDITGGTFTLSNLGMFGVDAFTAILNPPQAAILAVGRILERVVPVEGRPEVRPRMVLTLSCDHRALDGARAARFLEDLAGLIEEPWGVLA